MKLSKLETVPLTRETFLQFGDVMEINNSTHFSINGGAVERYHDLANIDIDIDSGGRAIISYFKINDSITFPHKFNLIERHPKGSQAFIPMFDEPVAIVVAPRGDLVTSDNLQAFLTNGRQGFNFHAGVWHMPLISEKSGRLFVVVDRAGPGNNCDELVFDNETIELTLT
jgi:ureidoglycolate lyase